MDAVLEHIPDVSKAFAEVGRTLKPGGVLVGYVAFMETFHEISYNHLSHKALEEYAVRNGMFLERVAPSGAFGIGYHVGRLVEPFVRFNRGLSRNVIRPPFRFLIRRMLDLLALKRYGKNRLQKRWNHRKSLEEAKLYRLVETLKFSAGLTFLIRKQVDGAPAKTSCAN